MSLPVRAFESLDHGPSGAEEEASLLLQPEEEQGQESPPSYSEARAGEETVSFDRPANTNYPSGIIPTQQIPQLPAVEQPILANAVNPTADIGTSRPFYSWVTVWNATSPFKARQFQLSVDLVEYCRAHGLTEADLTSIKDDLNELLQDLYRPLLTSVLLEFGNVFALLIIMSGLSVFTLFIILFLHGYYAGTRNRLCQLHGSRFEALISILMLRYYGRTGLDLQLHQFANGLYGATMLIIKFDHPQTTESLILVDGNIESVNATSPPPPAYDDREGDLLIGQGTGA